MSYDKYNIGYEIRIPVISECIHKRHDLSIELEDLDIVPILFRKDSATCAWQWGEKCRSNAGDRVSVIWYDMDEWAPQEVFS